MSCERCAESAAGGAKVCEFCGEPLDAPPVEETPAAALPSASAAPAQPPGEQSPARRVLTFIGGFLLALLVMGIGAGIGGAGGVIGAIIGAFGAPVVMIVMAQSTGARALAAGGITALAVVIIVFGGCLVLLTRALG